MGTRTKPDRPQGRVNTLDEVAALLRISRGSAYEAAKRREIPTIRIGRRLLVPCEALDRLLSASRGSGGETGAEDSEWPLPLPPADAVPKPPRAASTPERRTPHR